MGTWRRCNDCPRGFSSLIKLEAHAKAEHPVQVLAGHLHYMQRQLDGLTTAVHRYWGAREALESLVPIPPGARELLQDYVNKYNAVLSGRTHLQSANDQIRSLTTATGRVRDKLRKAGYIKAVQ